MEQRPEIGGGAADADCSRGFCGGAMRAAEMPSMIRYTQSPWQRCRALPTGAMPSPSAKFEGGKVDIGM